MDKNVIATMLIADLMNSTEVAKNLTLQEYDEMLVEFQNTMYQVLSSHLKEYGYEGNGIDSEWTIAGDELRVFLYSGFIRFDIRNALIIAMKIKLGWLASSFNRKVLREGRPVSRIGVGINCGKVIKDIRPWRETMGYRQSNIEGYAINLTKRIESASREGTAYQIMVGDGLHNVCQENKRINILFSPPKNTTFKGLGQHVPVYEVISFINSEIISTLPDSLKERVQEDLEFAASQPMPEPWVYITLLRHYISEIALKNQDHLAKKSLRVAQQALEVYEYKPVITNILGWLYTYIEGVRNTRMAMLYFKQTLERDPINQAALLHTARIHEMIGERTRAIKTYEELLEYNLHHTEAQRKLAQFKK